MPNPQTFHALRIHLIVSKPEVIQLDSAGRRKYLEDNFIPVLKTVNDLYNPPLGKYIFYANIRFVLDLAKDVEFDAPVEFLSGKALQERAALYRGKVVIFLRNNGGNAGSTADFFHLQDLDGNLMAHELGHYFGLGHSFFEGIKIADLPELIRKTIEKNAPGKIESEGYVTKVMNDLMDGDASYQNRWFWAKILDTPTTIHSISPDEEPPGFVICEAEFPVKVIFSNGYTHTYRFRPDVLNIMSYGHVSGCTPRYFSYQQIQVIHDIIESADAPRSHLLLVNPALKWSGWNKIQGNLATNTAPAAAAFGNRLYIFAKGNNDNRIYVNSALDGQPFGNWNEVQGKGTTDTAPAAAAFGNRLYVFAKGNNDNRVFVNSALDGQPFGNWSEVQGKGTTDTAPAAAAFGKRLYVFAKGKDDNRIYVNSALDGQPFGIWSELQGSNTIAGSDLNEDGSITITELQRVGTTNVTPAAAAFGNRLYIFAKGITDNRIYVNSAFSEQPFDGWLEVPGGGRTNATPTAVAFGNRLYVFAKGISDNQIYVNSAVII